MHIVCEVTTDLGGHFGDARLNLLLRD
jgi:hypothetical protein